MTGQRTSRMLAAALLLAAAFVLLSHPEPDARPATEEVPCDQLDHSKPEQGVKTFADEFDGTAVDRARWTVRDKTYLSFDDAYIRSDAVTVHDGLLDIEARREETSTGSGGVRRFTTGYLDTIATFSQQYGRWQMRAQLPTSASDSLGIWPAFWLRADDTPGEIDIMEAWGGPATRLESRPDSYSWTLHEDTSHGVGSRRLTDWATSRGDAPVYDGFHTFAVDWSPTCINFSLDGRVVRAIGTRDVPWVETAMAGPFNMRLNLQVGSEYHGFPDPDRADLTATPVSFLVDHVRVYGRPR